MSTNITSAIQGGNLTLTKAGLTGLSGAVTTFSTGGTITYANIGKLYTKATVSGGATPTVDSTTNKPFLPQAINTVACYAFGFDASGNTKVSQGKIVAYTDTTPNSTSVPLPLLPDAMTGISYAVIKNTASGTSWTFGTSPWNQTGITIDNPVDIMVVPPTDPLTA